MQAGLCLLAALTTVYFLSSSVGAYHVPRCLQRKEVGPCRANIPRYFYNRVSKMCELFYYGGCHGNSNNFATLDKCERSCVPRCFQTKYFGQYNKESIAQQRFYYNRFSKQCEPFHYGGRRGNDNNFRTSSECQRRCDICSLKRDPGYCKGHFPRYYYDSVSKSCKMFIYGGCGGNMNNFKIRQTCEARCQPKTETKHKSCAIRCPRKRLPPVCGSDGKTYPNYCILKETACRLGQNITFVHTGPCRTEPKTCAFPCPRKRLPPVCGSDGKTYPNYCILREKACKLGQDITFIHKGPCKTKSKTCAIRCSRKRLPPVCGSDGKTYRNYCMLKETACRLGQNITFVHRGPCGTKPKTCAVRCPRKRLPPVCGSDGKTYRNYCILKETACKLGQDITFVHRGPCKTKPKTCAVPCPRKRLPPVCGSDGNTYPNYCIMKETACQFGQRIRAHGLGHCKPKCQTKCTMEYNPQCGTDGKTYGNPCQLKATLCESDGKVRLAHHGECKPKTKPTCLVACPAILLPSVCGSDGNTYPNYCVLEETACQFKQNITVVDKGPCKPKCQTACTLEYNPQCGTDGKTYGNPCQLKLALCESDGKVRLDHHGECKTKKKTCAVVSPNILLPPVCGSDGNTYPNYCIMEETACYFKQNITAVGNRPCKPKCRLACTLEYNPQCGTDSRTYGNPCQLKFALCESDGGVKLAHHGKCEIKPKKCLVGCPRIILPPVCGSDGNTYPNYCILEETACQFKQNITVVGKEPCEPRCQIACTKEYNPQCGTDGKTYGNPCQLKATLCESDGKVRLDHHGECKTKPKKCLVACPKIMLPSVCGSDGNTYPNYCILEETACQFKQNITVVGKEPCEPRCQIACTKEYNPQCGTDGKTYGNPCQLKATLCESDGKVRLDHHGECKTKPKKCLVACPRIMLPPVCGSDGNTYPNYCILEETACQFKQNITVVGKEPCEPKCRNYCTLEYNPQCGTDGKTYGNPCQLKVAWCESDGEVRLDHHGECKTKPKKCLVACPRIILPPVCGSDGNTYPNYCILEETACQFKQNITVVGKEPCKPKCSAICTEEYNPQCGTDGRTYSNPCTFKQAQCESDGKIRLAHHGECKVPVEV
ncbi:agrin-like isoform X2 [Dendronephthya gigantea]|uniref:agrin-like isoform X2 n=1 Tax=Dendronephthya gigantea TaxID=151771 RepID=UPI00106D8DFE|nr:agrin-like isoform X2 [Dendronephthya gigantea]